MKKFMSLALALTLVCSLLVTPTFATTDYSNGTLVEYVATGNEAYTITVPATLAPGQEGTVTLSGTWASNKTVKVGADETVTLTNSINANDQKVLDVTFEGIEEAGDDTTSQTFTETVSVADIEGALFGTWSGEFDYNVELVDASNGDEGSDSSGDEEANIISFTIDGVAYQAEEGMTWGEWIDSDAYDSNSFKRVEFTTLESETYDGVAGSQVFYYVTDLDLALVLSTDVISTGEYRSTWKYDVIV